MIENLIETWKHISLKYGIKWKNSFIQWDLPEKISADFDFALSLTLPIVHKTKQNSWSIANEIIKSSIHFNLKWGFTKEGYINFKFPFLYYQDLFWKTFQTNGKNFFGKKKNLYINLEYVSTNPTGYLHLAHFRHAFVGNTLAKIYQFLGYQVIQEYYINDQGNQIVSLIDSIYYFYHQLQGEIVPFLKKIEYSGKSSQEIAKKIVEKWGTKYINKKLTKLDFEIWKKEILNLILTKIQKDLEKCGIKFDIWFSESSLYGKNQEQNLLTELKKKDLIYNQKGAVFFKSSLAGDEKDRVIIKQDGNYTYFFSDILYLLNKFQRADKLIYVWGADHHGTIARLKSACQLLGYPIKQVQIVLVQIVNLLTKEGQSERFSKREGNTIELAEALSYMAIDQLKFFLLEKEVNQSFTINVGILKEKQEKTSLYYLQYAHARCQQIFNKAQERKLYNISNNISLLDKISERKIFNWLIRFPFILDRIVEENKPHHLIHYLQELAKKWQSYYQNKNISVLNEANLELTSQRLLLVKNIQIILKQGLNLLGVEALERI